MAVERADLSVSLSLERMAPVPVAPAVQGQSSPENGGRKLRRHRPRPEKASANPEEENDDPPQHRIDSLA